MTEATPDSVDMEPTGASDPVLDEVLAGLARVPKQLPAKLFYDARGSALFEQITHQPEYYPTGCEIELLQRHAKHIASQIGEGVALLELGSGSSVKTRILLDHLQDLAAYVPVDISQAALDGAAGRLGREYPDLRIEPVCADYSRPFVLPDLGRDVRYAVFYPGSTIGNLLPEDAVGFLRRIRSLLKPEDGFIIGADLKKDPAILNAAYNDAAGITAEFNRNMLAHLNRRWDGSFDLGRFRHLAFYNENAGRVEMHLESLADQSVELAGVAVRFAAGERIHTENSYKYAVDEFQELLRRAGLEPRDVWLDAKGWFSVHRAVVTTEP